MQVGCDYSSNKVDYTCKESISQMPLDPPVISRPSPQQPTTYPITITPTGTTATTRHPRPLQPKEREERKKVLKLSVRKLRAIEDPETTLCRSVLINNTMKMIQAELRNEKARLAAAAASVTTPGSLALPGGSDLNLSNLVPDASSSAVQSPSNDYATTSDSSSSASDSSSSCSSSDEEEEAAISSPGDRQEAPETATSSVPLATVPEADHDPEESSEDEDEIMSASDMKRRAKKRAAEKATSVDNNKKCSPSVYNCSLDNVSEPPEKKPSLDPEDLLSEVYMPPSISNPYDPDSGDCGLTVPLPLRLAETSSAVTTSPMTTSYWTTSDSWSNGLTGGHSDSTKSDLTGWSHSNSQSGPNPTDHSSRPWSMVTGPTTTASDCWMTSATRTSWSNSSTFDWCSDDTTCDPWASNTGTTPANTTNTPLEHRTTGITCTTTTTPTTVGSFEASTTSPAGSPESLTSSSDSSGSAAVADLLGASSATVAKPGDENTSCDDKEASSCNEDQHLSCRHQSVAAAFHSTSSPSTELQSGVFNRMLSSLVTSLES